MGHSEIVAVFPCCFFFKYNFDVALARISWVLTSLFFPSYFEKKKKNKIICCKGKKEKKGIVAKLKVNF